MKTYHIKNKFLLVKINSNGAELKSILNQKSNFEYLWQAEKKIWGRTAPILFPIIGKEDGDGILIDDKVYPISQHGFARDYNFKLISINEDSISFELNDTLIPPNLYPYKFKLIVSYSLLENTIIQNYTVINNGPSNIYYSIGAHPAFILSSKNLNDYQIEFDGYDKLIQKEVKNNLLTGLEKVHSNKNLIKLY